MVLVFIASVGIADLSAVAQDLDLFTPEFFSLRSTTLGMGVGLATDYEGSDDFKPVPVPQFRYTIPNGCYVNLLGPCLRVNLFPSRQFAVGPMFRYRPERKSLDDDVVDELEPVDSAVEAGIFGSMIFNHFLWYAAYNKDISETHDGYLVDAAAGYRAGIESQVQFLILAIATYADDEYMQTYFGVNPETDLQSGLPEFDAKASLKNLGLLAALQYRINGNWAVLGIMKYTRLLGDAADSPIVDMRGDANQFMDAIILNYSF